MWQSWDMWSDDPEHDADLYFSDYEEDEERIDRLRRERELDGVYYEYREDI